ncbi:MAG TPA: tyrosine-type recombinase/integrase [Candidatus Angelobacter sp.]|nr:tyrosine-type recombinase/integrase [Candidatus Angelobacter sp.]
MSVFKRGEIYHYLFYVQGRRYKGSTGTSNPKEAAKIAARKRVTVERGEELKPKPAPLIQEAMKEFVEWIEQTARSPKTKADYKNGARLVLGSKLLGMRIDRITDDDINTTHFHDSPYSANSALRTLRRMLRRAKRKGDLLKDPPAIRCLDAPRREIMVADQDETRILAAIEQADGTRRYRRREPAPLREVFLIMMDSGMRDGEVVSMRWEHVHWQEAFYFNPAGKTKKARRRVPLSERVIALLREQQESCGSTTVSRHASNGKSVPKHGSSGGSVGETHPLPAGFVFPSTKSRSGHVELRALQRKFRSIADGLGLPCQLKLYCARHTFGTVAMDKTRNPYLVKEVMGHESLDTTMGYMHSETAQIKAVIDSHNRSKMVN